MKRASDNQVKAKIVLVDDHPMVRERLAQLINQQPDLKVCADVGDAAGCLQVVPQVEPDLIIVDLSLRGTHGLELIKTLHANWPELPIVVLSMHDESMYVERALRAGAGGYVTKHEATQTILVAIRRVLKGELHISENLARQLVDVVVRGRRHPNANPLDGLTDRELEIYQLLGQGHSARDIAELLHIDIKTVDTHRANLRDKLKLQNSGELRMHAAAWMRQRANP